MYKSTLSNRSPYTFTATIIHFRYGKNYDFITLVNIPSNTPNNRVVLTASVSPFNKVANYRWYKNNLFNNHAYEEYIRGISFTFFQEGYNYGKSKGVTKMNSALVWIILTMME